VPSNVRSYHSTPAIMLAARSALTPQQRAAVLKGITRLPVKACLYPKCLCEDAGAHFCNRLAGGDGNGGCGTSYHGPCKYKFESERSAADRDVRLKRVHDQYRADLAAIPPEPAGCGTRSQSRASTSTAIAHADRKRRSDLATQRQKDLDAIHVEHDKFVAGLDHGCPFCANLPAARDAVWEQGGPAAHEDRAVALLQRVAADAAANVVDLIDEDAGAGSGTGEGPASSTPSAGDITGKVAAQADPPSADRSGGKRGAVGATDSGAKRARKPDSPSSQARPSGSSTSPGPLSSSGPSARRKFADTVKKVCVSAFVDDWLHCLGSCVVADMVVPYTACGRRRDGGDCPT